MDTSKVSDALDAWVSSVRSEQRLYTPESREAIMKVFATADTMVTPAMMAVTGTQDVAAQQRKLFETQKQTGATSSESVQAMLDAPATGLMHVSDMARIAAGWNPILLEESAANSAAYQDYVNRLVKFPLVTLNYSQRQQMDRTTSDWDDLINSIADTFKGIEQKDKGAIVQGLKNLAQAASSTMQTVQKTSLFCQNAINTANDVYEFYLYNSTVTFREEKGKGFDTKQNKFDVLQVKLTLKMPLWIKENVQKIIGQTDGNLDDWLNNNQSSLKGTQPIPALNG